MTNEYLTIEEVADMARLSPKRIRNLMTAGVLVEGVHYTRPSGIRPRFKRKAVASWLEDEQGESGRQPILPQSSSRPCPHPVLSIQLSLPLQVRAGG